MKKTLRRILAILCLVCCVIAMQAQHNTGEVTLETAKQVADNFLALDKNWTGATEADVRLVEQEGVAVYYVVEYKQGGWAIVSAQSSSSPVIGYNTTGSFATPEPVKDLLDFNARVIKARAINEGDIEHAGWKRVKQRRAAASHINNTPDIEPLITINLDQSAPFNNYCPSFYGQQTLVGCVAVGMAQAMMVQGYPAKPVGKYSYNCSNTGWHYINYDEEPAYDWDAIYASPNTGNYDEIARLLYHCGVSVGMSYGLDASGAATAIVAEALVRNFGYNKDVVRYSIMLPDKEEWLDMLLDELEQGRAVVYHGQCDIGGHCWNIDGWNQATQMVHCNWGWSGYGNGYFSLENMTDSYQDLEFLYHHGAVFGVAAVTQAPYDIMLDKTHFLAGTEAGVALANVQVMSEDKNATYTYEVHGIDGTTDTPYQIVDGQVVSTETITNDSKFNYLCIKVVDNNSGESYEKGFDIQVVSGEVSRLVGDYDVIAQSAAGGQEYLEWNLSITMDRYDPNKVWLNPVALFGGLSAQDITPVYAIYDENLNTLTMPLGQVLYDSYDYRMITSSTLDGTSFDSEADIIMRVSFEEDDTKIIFADNVFFCVLDIARGKYDLWHALYNVELTQDNTVAADLSYLNGLYRANAHSAFANGEDESWKVTITADEQEPGVVWIKPICLFSNIDPEAVSPVYAYYEDDNTLLMPMGQVLYEDANYKMIIAKTIDGSQVDSYSTVPLHLTQDEVGVEISFADDWILGVGDVKNNQWWYQALHHLSFYKPHVVNSVPYDMYLRNTSFIKGTAAYIALSEVVVVCDDLEATYSYELFTRDNEQSPYIIDGNLLGSSEKIDDTDRFKYVRIKVTNTRTGESYEEAFDIEIQVIDMTHLEGEYNATAHSGFQGKEDDNWELTITVDEREPNVVWIQPICLCEGLDPANIKPVCAFYVDDNTIQMPLGQVIYENDKYRIVTAQTFNGGSTKDTEGSILMNIVRENGGVKISFATDFIFGLGDVKNDLWWYQAIHHVNFISKSTNTNVVIDDNVQSYKVDYEQSCESISYTRNFEDTEWQTWYVPFDVDYSLLAADFTVAEVNNVHQYDEDNDGVIDATAIEAITVKYGKLKANYPYLIRANRTGEYTIVVENATLHPTVTNSIDCASVSHRFVCTGTYIMWPGSILASNNFYTLSGEYFAVEDADLGAFRWYMNIENRGTQPTPARVKLRVENSSTDLDGVAQDGAGEVEYYDLSGRRVEHPTMGVYIMKQGDVVKKVVVNRR